MSCGKIGSIASACLGNRVKRRLRDWPQTLYMDIRAPVKEEVGEIGVSSLY
jgi:hypothetical protein